MSVSPAGGAPGSDAADLIELRGHAAFVAACCAPRDRCSCRHRHHWYPDLIYGFVANFFPTRVRGAGVAWCAGFGPRRRWRAPDWRSSYRIRAVDRHNLLCAGWPRPCWRRPHTRGAGQQNNGHCPLSSDLALPRRAKSIRREDNNAILSRRLCSGRPGHSCSSA